MNKVFRYPLKRSVAVVKRASKRISIEKREVEVVGTINGFPVDSVEEWRVYKGILKAGLEFRYQVPMTANANLRCGVILDFMVFNPFPIPLPVHGARWHGDERIEDAVIANYFNVTIDYVQEHVIWDYEIPTQEDANRIVRQRAR